MTEIQKFVNDTLPVLSKNLPLVYNKENNLFTSPAYTSLAGNTYFQGIRLSERIIIETDIGIGWLHTFLNGIRIISCSNPPKLLASEYYHCCYYSESTVKSNAKQMIKKFLIDEARKEDCNIDLIWLEKFCDRLIEDTYNNQLETLRRIKANQLLSGNNTKLIA